MVVFRSICFDCSSLVTSPQRVFFCDGSLAATGELQARQGKISKYMQVFVIVDKSAKIGR